MTANDDYQALTTQLGCSGSERLQRILENMMTPDQAKMVIALPGTPAEVAEKTGFDVKETTAALEDLFFKGAVVPKGDFVNRERYRFHRSVGQFHDVTAASLLLDAEKDKEFFELWYDFVNTEMYPQFAENFKKTPGPIQRMVPAWGSIKDLDGILPTENFPEMMAAQNKIAVVPCSCRLITNAVGEPCETHDETKHEACVLFNRSAEYAIARGSGRELTIEEALELSDIWEESGLLHKWQNNTTVEGVGVTCQCCRDCCMDTVPVDTTPSLEIGQIWAKSRYVAYDVQDNCTGCQTCIDRCLFDAIEMVKVEGSKKMKAAVDPDKCFGCGVCVIGCDVDALKMKLVRPPDHIPVAGNAPAYS